MYSYHESSNNMSNIFFTDSSLTTGLAVRIDENELAMHALKQLQDTTLSRQLRKLAPLTDPVSVRPLVELFYKIQDLRVYIGEQSLMLTKNNHDSRLLTLGAEHLQQLEAAFVHQIHQYATTTVVGTWALAQHGVGPVLTAGLLSHIDITKAPTAGSIWRYAGLDPSTKWDKNSKRPWNEQLKALTHKIGVSFARHANHTDCFYGKFYLADLERRTSTNSDALSDDHLRAQARRFAVKIFLSHYHAVAYQDHHGVPAPRPYHIDYRGQQVYVSIPKFPFADGY